MRIGLNRPEPEPISPGPSATASSNATRPESAENNESLPEDTVTVGNLSTRALQTPEVRQQEVERLQQSVLTGQYKIDTRAIAEAMLKG